MDIGNGFQVKLGMTSNDILKTSFSFRHPKLDLGSTNKTAQGWIPSQAWNDVRVWPISFFVPCHPKLDLGSISEK